MHRHNQSSTARAQHPEGRAESEDTVQEPAARVPPIGNFRGDAKLSTWLVRIVVNEHRARSQAQPRAEVIQLSGESRRIAKPRGNMDNALPEQPRARAACETRRLLEAKIDDCPTHSVPCSCCAAGGAFRRGSRRRARIRSDGALAFLPRAALLPSALEGIDLATATHSLSPERAATASSRVCWQSSKKAETLIGPPIGENHEPRNSPSPSIAFLVTPPPDKGGPSDRSRRDRGRRKPDRHRRGQACQVRTRTSRCRSSRN